MSYLERERSEYAGHPLELYRFAMGEQQWLFTSADHAVAYGEDLYQPRYIERGGFTKGADSRKSDLEIKVSASNPVALLFRTGWLSGILVVTVFRHHYEDSEFSVLWKGRVTGCKWSGSQAALAAESMFTLFQRAGLRRKYQVGCPHILFGQACGLNADAWKFEGIVSSVVGNQVAVGGASALGSGYFLGGMAKVGDEYRMITAHAGNVVTLVDGVVDLVEGSAITLWPGCARTVNACLNKFANLDNFGGLPYLPAKNPFRGDALV